jgi:hypothetical protein
MFSWIEYTRRWCGVKGQNARETDVASVLRGQRMQGFNIELFSFGNKKPPFQHVNGGFERVMGLEPTISCLGSKRSTTELHPHRVAL